MDIQVRRIRVLFVLSLLVLYVKSDWSYCDPQDPPVIRKININQIKGRWFSERVKPASPTGNPAFFVFSLDIRSRGQVILNGRPVGSPLSCLYEPAIFKKIDERKNSYSALFKFQDLSIEWRFITVLRGRYLVTWACFDFDKRGKCRQNFVDVYSRSPKPIPNSVLRRLNRDIKKTLCADTDIFRDFIIDPLTSGACPKVEIIQDGQFRSQNFFQIGPIKSGCRY